MCPGCGAGVKDEDRCGVCGTDLHETPSESLGDVLRQEPKKEEGVDDIHWKREALVPPMLFLSLSLGLMIPGFLLSLYSSPVLRPFTPYFIGLILIWLGFMVLLFMVIGAGPSYRRSFAKM